MGNGCNTSSFGDYAPFAWLQIWPNFPFGPWGKKIESAQKFRQIEVNVKCMETNFDGHGFSSSGDFVPFVCLQNKWPKFPFGPWLSPWGSKNKIDFKNSCK